jgi:hypothetical protein
MQVKISKKYLQILIHILIWGCVIFIPRLFMRWPQDFFTLRDIIIWSTMIGAFYLNYYLLIPVLLNKKKILLYVLSLFTMLLLAYYTNVGTMTNEELARNIQDMKRPLTDEQLMDMQKGMHRGRAIGSAFVIFLIVALGTSIRVTGQWYSNEEKRKEIENQKLSTELSFLKSQINPHFFFNTLNSIYSLAYKKSDRTPEAIVKLSMLMRYIIYESDKDRVPLEKELEYIQNYVELQKLRLRENVTVVFEPEGNYRDHQIAPLLILPFVENAFKHGIDYTKDCNIQIRVMVTGDQLSMQVENPVVEKQASELEEAGGIGMKNIKKRLSLIYPGRHDLQIRENEHTFTVELKLNLHELPDSRR